MPKISFIKPIATSADELRAELAKWSHPDVELELIVAAPDGPSNIEFHAYETVVAPRILATVAEAERSGSQAAIIGCFYDTALAAAREIATIPVVGPCQSSLHIASLLGTRFAVMVGRSKWIPKMRSNVAAYGFGNAVAGFPVLDLGVTELQHDREATFQRMVALGRDALDRDGVDVLILGCTIEFGFAERLQDELAVPVIEAGRAALKYAELAAELGASGWRTSKAGGYAPPGAADLQAAGLSDLSVLPALATNGASR